MSERLVTDQDGNLFETSTATFDSRRLYRYRLTRTWDTSAPPLMFIMLNPSTADAFVPDPTITRCIGFAKREGAGGLVVCNLFGFRATNPNELLYHPHPVGNSNDELLVDSLAHVDRVIVAWGVPGRLHDRDRKVMRLLAEHGVEPLCLDVTKDGLPKHPLYVKADQPLQPYHPEHLA
ncbi:DUF1643 domain-containing protein [Actinosynnema sp. NPDC059335]|uniref:DUF1643 domain-containing protein n=1 Tax=Actinosynnema sp. NPDC059335 TaxID=3346804 RepID=UPI003672A2D1